MPIFHFAFPWSLFLSIFDVALISTFSYSIPLHLLGMSFLKNEVPKHLRQNIYKKIKACISLPYSSCSYLSNLCVMGTKTLSAVLPLKAKSYIQCSHIIVIDLKPIQWFLYPGSLSDFHFLNKKGWSSISGYMIYLLLVLLQNFLSKYGVLHKMSLHVHCFKTVFFFFLICLDLYSLLQSLSAQKT